MKKKLLLIYTGGTIGMIKDKTKKTLVAFNFNNLLQTIPELKTELVTVDHISTKKPVDSSNINIENWIEIAKIIKHHYLTYDSFVILHGTDTMAYTASALSFMLENLDKAVIFTGSQIPIGERRTDAKENLITSVEIAISGKVNEVCICFEDQLYRANRTVKINTEHFEAFRSPNFPVLAKAGVKIKYHNSKHKRIGAFKAHLNLSNDVVVLRLFPGINMSTIKSIINTAKGIVIESFGAGNASSSSEFYHILQTAINSGKIILNITQCLYGSAAEGRYETSNAFKKSGVICGKDMTTEAAITKLMFLLGKRLNNMQIKRKLAENLEGEITE